MAGWWRIHDLLQHLLVVHLQLTGLLLKVLLELLGQGEDRSVSEEEAADCVNREGG